MVWTRAATPLLLLPWLAGAVAASERSDADKLEDAVAGLDEPAARQAYARIAGKHREWAAYPIERGFAAQAAKGDLGKLEAVTRLIIALYGTTERERSATFFWQLCEAHQTLDGHLLGLFEEYLRDWARYGQPGHAIVAHTRVGQFYWQRSCPSPTADGACVQVDNQPPLGKRDGSGGVPQRACCPRGSRYHAFCIAPTIVKTLPREAKAAAIARGHLRAVLELARPLPPAGRTEAVRKAAGTAAFLLGDAEYEALLRIPLPTDMDLSQPTQWDSKKVAAAKARSFARSRKLLDGYLESKQRQLDEAGRLYLDALALGGATWSIAVQARLGQLHRHWGLQLDNAAVPDGLGEQDAWGNRPREIFCEALQDTGKPLRQRAAEYLRACASPLFTAADEPLWQEVCARELERASAEISKPWRSDCAKAEEIRPAPPSAPDAGVTAPSP
jgi:hypothetical protein